MLESFNHLYAKIGPAGVVLLFVAVVGFYLAIKNVIFLWLIERDFRKTAISIENAPNCRDNILEANVSNPLVAILDGVIKTHGTHSDDLKAEVAYLFHKHFTKPLRDLVLLRVIAVISPLLGLLGTLLGLLGVFQSISVNTSSSTTTILASGIWEAILTTIMGLVIAIPALVAYYALNLKVRAFHLTAIEYGYRFLEFVHICRNIPKKDLQKIGCNCEA